MPRWFMLAGCLSAMLLCASCGASGKHSIPDTIENVPITSTLPALAGLAQPTRKVDTLAQGYLTFALDDELDSSGAVPSANGLQLTALTEMSWAIYGMYGFDGDNGPVSARITTNSVNGEYYVGFSNYAKGVWAFAGPFKASAEVAIPNPAGLRLPEAFVSSAGAGYIALVVSKGNSLDVKSLQLGVQGGQDGPGPVSGITASGDAGSLLLTWSPSADQERPDFAGYLIERAELLAGDYVALTPAPQPAPYFIDTTAAAGQQYRYRVSALDSGANTSPWTTAICGPVTGALANPVAVLTVPRGSLTAPAEVALDLSASFDPGGEDITTYSLDFGGLVPPTSGAGPHFTLTLPPGCYQIIATVETTDARTGHCIGRVRVLPQWEAAPVLVRETSPVPSAGQSRLDHLRGINLPGAEGMLLAGEDHTMGSMAFWTGKPGSMKVQRLPLVTEVDYIGEPVLAGSTVYIPYCQRGAFCIATYADGKPTCTVGPARSDAPLIAAASDGTALWLIYAQNNAGSIDLQYTTVNGTPATGVIAAGIGGLNALDAVYNPTAHAIEIAYSDNDSMEWLEWDVTTQSVTGDTALAFAVCAETDIEMDAATNRPCVVFAHDSYQRYSEQAEDRSWTAEELIDNTETNYTPYDLLITGGHKLCYFALGSGHAYLFERTEPGVWVRTVTPDFTADSAYNAVLLPPAGDSTALAQVADIAGDGKVYLAELNADGTDTLADEILPGCGQGYDMHSAAAADGLHVIWRGNLDSQVQHYFSNDGGATWGDAGTLGTTLSNLDLASTRDGELYLSAFDGGNNVLYHWNGGGWDTRWWDGSDGAGRAFLGHNPTDAIRWVAFEPWSGTIHYVSGSEGGGFGETTAISSARPIWTGALGGAATPGTCFTLTSGASWFSTWLGFYNFGEGLAQLNTDFTPAGYASLANRQVVAGRELACADYVSATSGELASGGVCISGPSGRPLRCVIESGAPVQVEELPIGEWIAGDPGLVDGREALRTASCAAAAGTTGVMLVASWDGTERYFAWSNFGEWQELPLPAGLAGMAADDVLVGMDGRWHIIYKDWRTDSIMCWSSK
jgi:hypothetical protein